MRFTHLAEFSEYAKYQPFKFYLLIFVIACFPVTYARCVTQSRIIRKLASEQSCIIIGRCADYVLRDFKNCFKVFIHADYDSKLKRATAEYHEPEEKAVEKLKHTDHGRANHYRTYTGAIWNDASHYDLCLDSSLFGVDGCCKIIGEIIEQNYLKQKNN